MDEHEFEAQLKADGYTEIERQTLEPRPGKGRQARPHEFTSGRESNAVRALLDFVARLKRRACFGSFPTGRREAHLAPRTNLSTFPQNEFKDRLYVDHRL